MFRSARGLAVLLALGLLAKPVITAPPFKPRSDASVSHFLRIVVLSALLNALEISWGSCESFGVNTTGTNLECAYLDVPMDYHDSSAGNARLAVIKMAATVNKLGTIFFNPGSSLHPSFVAFHQYPIFTGGPGSSGIKAMSAFARVFAEYFQGAFDVVSWDPRGVGYTLWVRVVVSRCG